MSLPFLLLLLVSSRLYADDVDALQAAKRSYEIEHFQGFEQLAVGYEQAPDMRLFSFSGGALSEIATERLLRHEAQTDGLLTLDRVSFHSGKLRGNAILLESKAGQPGKFMMWLPSLRKLRRFAEPALNDVWAGSNLSYGDLYLRRPEHEKHTLLESAESELGCLKDILALASEILQKLPSPERKPWCYSAKRAVITLRSEPVYAGAEYAYRLRTLDAISFAEYRAEYFDAQGHKLKQLEKAWYRVTEAPPDQWLWRFWSVRVFADEAVGQDRAQSLAWIPVDAIAINPGLPRKLWSERALRKIRR